jgi:hypothetical protein
MMIDTNLKYNLMIQECGERVFHGLDSYHNSYEKDQRGLELRSTLSFVVRTKLKNENMQLFLRMPPPNTTII